LVHYCVAARLTAAAAEVVVAEFRAAALRFATAHWH